MAQRKILNCHTYKYDPKLHNENSIEGESETVQGQAPTLRETMERFAQGLVIGNEHEVFYQGEDGTVDFSDVPDILRMDNDLVDLQKIVQRATDQYNAKLEELLARKQEIEEKAKKPIVVQQEGDTPPEE